MNIFNLTPVLSMGRLHILNFNFCLFNFPFAIESYPIDYKYREATFQLVNQ